MLSLSPTKILIVLVVAMVLLGPDKLPQVARQMGGAWRALRGFHQRVDSEIRESMPDLPSTSEIARLARSPVAFLNKLADMPADDLEPPIPDPGAPSNGTAADHLWPADPIGATAPNGHVPSPAESRVDPSRLPPASPGDPGTVVVPDDPSMN